MVPVHKKGNKQDPRNYRPISLTSVFSKIFEKCVLKYLLEFLLSHDLIYDYQSGFLPQHSTASQLCEIYNKIVFNIDSHLATSIIFCDISRAFDRLSHRGIYSKLVLYGFSSCIRNWILSFLTGRKQRTNVNGSLSDWGELGGGIAQGSVLGPIVFLLMINDLPTYLDTDCRLFADDTTLLFTHPPDLDISDIMTRNMTRLQDWADTWLFHLNLDKTHCMTISLARNICQLSPKFKGKQISLVDSHKHLGLYLNSRANWSDHIQFLITKATKRLGILRSLKYKLNRSSLRILYVTHIRSLFDYCDIVWDNCTSEESQSLERLQLDAIRIFTGLPRYSRTNDLYSESALEPLVERRRQHRLIALYKIIYGYAPAYLQNMFPPMRSDYSIRGHRGVNVFQLPLCRTSIYAQSFVPRTIRDWNCLNVEIRTIPSLISFKRMIRPPVFPLPMLDESNRFSSIVFTRLKHDCSTLNEHLYRVNLVPSPLCECRTGSESVFHFFYDCPFYDRPRERLILELVSLDLHDLSIGFIFDATRHSCPELTISIQRSIYRFIVSSGRFR